MLLSGSEPPMLLNLTELSAEPMHSQVSRQLRARILTGELAEETPLPAVRSFARQHRLDARSVERAYEDLEREGLLERAGGGFRVAPVSAQQKQELARAKLPGTVEVIEASPAKTRMCPTAVSALVTARLPSRNPAK